MILRIKDSPFSTARLLEPHRQPKGLPQPQPGLRSRLPSPSNWERPAGQQREEQWERGSFFTVAELPFCHPLCTWPYLRHPPLPRPAGVPAGESCTHLRGKAELELARAEPFPPGTSPRSQPRQSSQACSHHNPWKGGGPQDGKATTSKAIRAETQRSTGGQGGGTSLEAASWFPAG